MLVHRVFLFMPSFPKHYIIRLFCPQSHCQVKWALQKKKRGDCWFVKISEGGQALLKYLRIINTML